MSQPWIGLIDVVAREAGDGRLDQGSTAHMDGVIDEVQFPTTSWKLRHTNRFPRSFPVAVVLLQSALKYYPTRC